MSEVTAEQLFSTEFQSSQEQMAQVVDMLTVIDTGVIVSVDAAGRAVIASNKSIGGKRVMYENVEVIGFGNTRGCFMVDGVNCSCLVLVPRTPTPDIDTQKIAFNSPLYDKRGMKALPITNCYNSQIRVSIDSSGSFHILSKDVYDITFQEDSFSYTDGTWVVSLGAAGKLYIRRQDTETGSGAYEYALDSSGFTESYTSVDEKLYWEKAVTDTGVAFTVSMGTPSDGSETDEWDEPIQVRPNNYKLSFSEGACTLAHTDADGEELTTITIGADGSLSISTPVGVSLSTEDSLSITTSADVEVSAEGDVTVTGDNVSVAAKTKATINGPNGSVEIS